MEVQDYQLYWVLIDNANICLINRQYKSAINVYSSVIEKLESDLTSTSSSNIGMGLDTGPLLMKFRAYSHRAETILQMKDSDPAMAAKDTCIALDLLTIVPADGDGKELQSLLIPGEAGACRARKERALDMMKKTEGSSTSSEKNHDLDSNQSSSKTIDTVKKDSHSVKTTHTGTVNKDKTRVSSAVKVEATKESSSVSNNKRSSALTCPKYQYYQNENVMTIAILEPNVKPQHLQVDFGLDTINVVLEKSSANSTGESTAATTSSTSASTSFTVISNTRTLFDAIDVGKCKITYKEEKVLIKLRKRHKHEWHDLFGSGASQEDKDKYGDKEDKIKKSEKKGEMDTTNVAQKGRDNTADDDKTTGPTNAGRMTSSHDSNNKPTRPYASDKDWNAIDRQLAQEEANEKPEGEEAINSLFQSIYKNADPDTRRAMIKSFQTSGGTCLSTNWNEVQQTDYEDPKHRQAPKGSEWKNWEGDRLPQKDDD